MSRFAWNRGAVCILALFVTLSGSRPAAAQSAPASEPSFAATDPAVFAPQDALAFAGVADLEKFLSDFAKSGMGLLFADRAAAGAFAEVKDAQALYDDYRGRIARAVGVELAEMKWPLGGACAAFVYRMKGEAGGGELFLGYGVTMGVRDAATAKDYYAKLVTNLKAIAPTSDSTTSGADRIDFFVLRVAEPAGDDFPGMFEEPTLADAAQVMAALADWRTVALCLRDDRLFVGDSIGTVKAMLKREIADSLAAAKDYAAIDRLFGRTGGLRMLVDVPQGVRIARELEGQGAKELETLLGAGCMRSVIGVFDSNGETYDNRLDLMLLMDGPRTGVAKIVSPPNEKTARLGDVPADAIWATDIAIDPGSMFDEIERIAERLSPSSGDARLTVMTQSGEVLHLRDDLLRVLKPPLRVVVTAPASNDPGGARAWVSMGHSDEKKLAKWLAYVREFAPLTDREVGGRTVYDMPFNASIAILKDRVVVGTTEAVDALIESPAARTLADLPEFRRALKLVPDEASMVDYQNVPRLVRTCAAIGVEPGQLMTLFMQKPGIAAVYYAATWNALGPVGPGFQDRIEPFAKLCGPEITTTVTTADGVRSTTVVLKPAGSTDE